LESCTSPSSKIFRTTSSEFFVPNSFSSTELDARSNLPCAPCLVAFVNTIEAWLRSLRLGRSSLVRHKHIEAVHYVH
jgi:hypothetical protein